MLTITRDHELDPVLRPVELVERKGIGHPDTLCDRAAEEVSIVLSRYYREHFGAILHHNTDKVLLVGGRAHAAFGHGEVLEPIYLLLSGRATGIADGQHVPVGPLALRHTETWLRETLPHLRLPGDIILDYRIKPSSPDLVALFRRSGAPLANDTSFAVAYSPLSELEQIVLRLEHELNTPALKGRYPQIGEDIKVMGVREGEAIHLTLSVAFVARNTPDMDTYLDVKHALTRLCGEWAAEFTRREIHVAINTADLVDEGCVYLTATGTSAEAGDDGEVGRGNRANGLITPMRPMTLEAAAGKNPVSHVGKVYQVFARRIVDRTRAEIPEIRAAACAMLSRIGSPITEPQSVAIRVDSDLADAALRDPIARIVREVLDDWETVRDGFLERRWGLY